MSVESCECVADSAYVRNDRRIRSLARRQHDNPIQVLRPLLDDAWRAIKNMRGSEIVDATSALREWSRLHSASTSAPDHELITLLAIGSVWEDKIDQALYLASSALRHGGSRRFRTMLIAVQKFAHWQTRDLAAFYTLGRAKLVQTHPVSVLPTVVCLSIESIVESEQLRLRLAERLAREALALSDRYFGIDANASLLASCNLARLLYEAGVIDEADRIIKKRLQSIIEYGSVESALIAFPTAANIAYARGNVDLAFYLLQRGEALGIRRGWHRLALHCRIEAITVMIRTGQLARASRECEVLPNITDRSGIPEPCRWAVDIVCVRLAMAGQAETKTDTVNTLFRIRDAAINFNHQAWVVKLTILLSIALFSAGDFREAREQMLDALHQGTEVGLFRTFLDEMPAAKSLLRLCLNAPEQRRLGHLRAYIGSLLSAHNNSVSECPKNRQNHGEIKALTEREAAILRFISLGLSNKSIGRELHIAPETVKSHVKNIFIKLSTKTRAEAVSRAVEMGML